MKLQIRPFPTADKMQVTVGEQPLTIGRHSSNMIAVPDDTISRFHARVEMRDGQLVLQDLGSQNGIEVNGTRIQKQHVLKEGERFVIGRLVGWLDGQGGHKSDPGPADFKSNRPDTGRFDSELLEIQKSSGDEACFWLYKDGQRTESILLKKATLIGRGETCDVKIPHPGVSRNHCQVEFREGQFWLIDLGSHNGTMINDQVVRDKVVLKDRDVIHFYEYALVAELPTINPDLATGPTPMLPEILIDNGRGFDTTSKQHVKNPDPFKAIATAFENLDHGSIPTAMASPWIEMLRGRIPKGRVVVEAYHKDTLKIRMPFDAPYIFVGRHEQCQIQLTHDPAMASFSALMIRCDGGFVFISLIPPEGQEKWSAAIEFLAPGDSIQIGETELRIEVNDA